MIDNKLYKDCEVIMLQADEASIIVLNTINSRLMYDDDKSLVERILPIHGRNQHIYVLSNEKVKQGDWVYHPEISQEYTIVNQLKEGDDRYLKAKHPAQGVFQYKETTNPFYQKCKKIIATTAQLPIDIETDDGGIIPTYLPNPSDEFVIAYISAQGKGFEQVSVEYEEVNKTMVCTGMTGKPAQPVYNWIGDHQLKITSDNKIVIKPFEKKTSWAKKEVEDLLQQIVNDSHCGIKRIKNADSNKCAEFTNNWIQNNLI